MDFSLTPRDEGPSSFYDNARSEDNVSMRSVASMGAKSNGFTCTKMAVDKRTGKLVE